LDEGFEGTDDGAFGEGALGGEGFHGGVGVAAVVAGVVGQGQEDKALGGVLWAMFPDGGHHFDTHRATFLAGREAIFALVIFTLPSRYFRYKSSFTHG
jgi:hypothetical protein